jgi:O-antigen/teichoic acid export membrane protein
LLLYLGRFVIAAVISAEAVAFFVVPYEIIVQFLVIPSVLVAVLFPVLSQIGEKNAVAVSGTYRGALIAVSATMIPLVALSISLAEPGIAFWINQDFAAKSFRVAQFLSLGVFINSIGLISQVVVQASGHPDWTAKLHLFELLLYVPYLLFLTDTLGIEGAAVAWVVRVAISTLVLLYLARRVIDRPGQNSAWLRIR